MKNEIKYFDMSPKIVPANQEAEIAIQPLFEHSRFDSGATYGVTYYPVEEFSQRSGWSPGGGNLILYHCGIGPSSPINNSSTLS